MRGGEGGESGGGGGGDGKGGGGWGACWMGGGGGDEINSILRGNGRNSILVASNSECATAFYCKFLKWERRNMFFLACQSMSFLL